MSGSKENIEPLYSDLELDDSLEKLLFNLIRKIPTYEKDLQACLENATKFKRLCHEMSGTFSSYGFPVFFEACREVESLANPSEAQINSCFAKLSELLLRIKRAYPIK